MVSAVRKVLMMRIAKRSLGFALVAGLLSFPVFSFDGTDFDMDQSITMGISPTLVNPDRDRGKKHDSNDVGFSTLDKGAVSGIETNERLAVREELQWITIWKKHSQAKKVPQVMPHVDFENSMVLAVFEGDKPGSSGSMVSIERVRLFKDRMVVILGHDDIGSGANKTTLRSYHIVSLPRTNLPVVFH